MEKSQLLEIALAELGREIRESTAAFYEQQREAMEQYLAAAAPDNVAADREAERKAFAASARMTYAEWKAGQRDSV